jgi:2,4-dienoyl-CoA reductase-like NADH-dependent reductase (Old Yellow Enzyme family)
MKMDYKNILLSPIKIGNRTAPNRFFIQAMECTDADADGNPSDLTYKRYENLFRGEAGVITLEAISITKESRSRLNQLMITPENLKPLTQFVKRMKEINPNSLFVFQLTHSGELSNPGFSRRVCVKPLPGFGGEILTEEELDKLMDDFVLAAKIAHEAGADGIDMKLCHGYLGSQILRPYNDRKWKYGGSWENRRQFAFDLYERIQNEVNDKNFLIGSKISTNCFFFSEEKMTDLTGPDYSQPPPLLMSMSRETCMYLTLKWAVSQFLTRQNMRIRCIRL